MLAPLLQPALEPLFGGEARKSDFDLQVYGSLLLIHPTAMPNLRSSCFQRRAALEDKEGSKLFLLTFVPNLLSITIHKN